MVRVQIRHYVVKRGRGFWQPTKAMRAAGFASKPLGVDGPEAWAEAEQWNKRWDRQRKGEPMLDGARWDADTLGDIFERYRKLTIWTEKAPRTRDEWEDVWERALAPVFGDVPVNEIDVELVDEFYKRLGNTVSLHRQHRVMKIFRALLNVASTMGLIKKNPTYIIENIAPKGRTAIWPAADVELAIAAAQHMGYRGLAVAIAIIYDTQFQPVDVRELTLDKRRSDASGGYFDTHRRKTSKRALGTMTQATEQRLDTYIAELGVTLAPSAPILRNRSGAPYSKDLLTKDFRKVREALWVDDKRRLQDLRRTGNVEAVIGGAEAPTLSAKSGNTIGQSNALFETYTPVQLAAVREADKARVKGRRKLDRRNG